MKGILRIGSKAYDVAMASLPAPARFLKISELADDPGRYERELEDGGAIVLVSEDGEHAFALTREPGALGTATIAAMIENRSVPSIEEMDRTGYEGEDPVQIAKAIAEGRSLLGPKSSS